MKKQHEPELFDISLKVLLKNNKNEFLLLKAVPKGYLKSKYDLPGGRINKNEVNGDFEKLIGREIAEETGKSVKYRLRKDPVSIAMDRYGEKGKFFILFEAIYRSGKITISEEHTDYAWVRLTKKNLPHYFNPSFTRLLTNYFNWNS